MVLPGDDPTVRIKAVTMRDGDFIVGVNTINQRGEKVLEGAGATNYCLRLHRPRFAGAGCRNGLV
jgi:acyl dehydratase